MITNPGWMAGSTQRLQERMEASQPTLFVEAAGRWRPTMPTCGEHVNKLVSYHTYAHGMGGVPRCFLNFSRA
jgi:hypothetical protein